MSLLVAGPPGTGRRAVTFDLLSEGCVRSQRALVVSTGPPPAELYRELDDRVASLAPSQVGVVDATARATDHEFPSGVSTAEAEPGDFTGLGLSCSNYFERGEARTRVALFSITDLLELADLKTVFRFLHILSGRISAADALGLFLLNTEAHDERTRHTLQQLFDLQVETRDGADGPAFRVRGAEEARADWHRL